MSDFTPKRFDETEIFSVTYEHNLAVGETLTSAVWHNSVVRGVDPNPSAMLVGSAVINGAFVSQILTGGIPGVTYAPTCTATTSMGQTIILPDPGDYLLRVVA